MINKNIKGNRLKNNEYYQYPKNRICLISPINWTCIFKIFLMIKNVL
jgi:hypothetical protein